MFVVPPFTLTPMETTSKEFLNLVDRTNESEEESDRREVEWRKIREMHEFASIFSIDEVADLYRPALVGSYKVYFMGRYNRAENKAFAPVKAVTDPTWLDLWRAADFLISKQEAGYRTDLYVEKFIFDEDGDLEVRYGS